MAEKKKHEAEKPLHTIRCGQIVATIEERQTNAGFSYLQYSIGRRWQVKSSRSEKQGSGLFAHQENEVIEAVKAACAYIKDRASAVGGIENEPVCSGSGTTSEDSSNA